jgi:hypothetical protein
MKFSDKLLASVSSILETRPTMKFDNEGAHVYNKAGKKVKSFERKDHGTDFRKHADVYMAKNVRELYGSGNGLNQTVALNEEDNISEEADAPKMCSADCCGKDTPASECKCPATCESCECNAEEDSKEEASEAITKKHLKQAKGIAFDKRYKGGNYSGAAKVMDKIHPGLSDHPVAMKHLKHANEATMVPGFIGADGKATSKPTKKDFAANKEYQGMKKKLGDRIPGPKATKEEKYTLSQEDIDFLAKLNAGETQE